MDNIESEYDFKNTRKNPYAKRLQKQVTANIIIYNDNKVIKIYEKQSDTNVRPNKSYD